MTAYKDIYDLASEYGDSTAEMVDAIFQPVDAERIKADLTPMLNIGYGQGLNNEQRFEAINTLENCSTQAQIIQGQLLELLWVGYAGNRKLFYADCLEKTHLQQQSVDDRRRVYKKLNALLHAAQLTWASIAVYVASVSFTLWREITRDKYDGRWEWRDGQVCLTNCVGAGQELSTFRTTADKKAEQLLVEALKEPAPAAGNNAGVATDATAVAGGESNFMCLTKDTTPTGSIIWNSIPGQDDEGSRTVEGMNVEPVEDSPETAFKTVEIGYAFYVDEREGMAADPDCERVLNFYDMRTDRWLTYNLPSIDN